MKTATWVKLHGYISMFFLPMALIYAVTGAFVIVGERGELKRTEFVIEAEPEIFASIDSQKERVVQELKKRGENLPAGKPRLWRKEFYWGRSSSINVSLKKAKQPGKAELQIRKPDLLFASVILHRARGGRLFDYLGFAFAIAMIFFYVSGIFIFWKIKPKRVALSLTLVAGTVVTIVFFVLSL
ncbi:MAG: PepSY domain-containing protein [Candidatus Rifleibacteriota bacterium]